MAKQAKPKPGAIGKQGTAGGNRPPAPRSSPKQVRVPVKK